MKTKKIAIIGSGISGLSAGYWLAKNTNFEVSLFEARPTLGGHSYTVDIPTRYGCEAVDMGFLVHNDRTYPELVRIFNELEIKTHPSEMTFGVSVERQNDILEWAGTNLFTLFAQKKNLFSSEFHKMVFDILDFNSKSQEWLEEAIAHQWTLGQLLKEKKYSQGFQNWYLLPMGAAIWSTPLHQMLDFPAETFIRFCINHGLLQISNRPQWKTVYGGSRVYVQKIARWIPHVYTSSPVIKIKKNENNQWRLSTPHGSLVFDALVFATHPDQALEVGAHEWTQTTTEILSSIRYSKNQAYLHFDTQQMPKNKTAWAAWNYLSRKISNRNSSEIAQKVSVTYWINKLQPLSIKQPVLVTLNPASPITNDKIFHQVQFEHPLFDQNAIIAQKKLSSVQGIDQVYFAGAWTRYGFHEDGCLSGLQVANLLKEHSL